MHASIDTQSSFDSILYSATYLSGPVHVNPHAISARMPNSPTILSLYLFYQQQQQHRFQLHNISSSLAYSHAYPHTIIHPANNHPSSSNAHNIQHVCPPQKRPRSVVVVVVVERRAQSWAVLAYKQHPLASPAWPTRACRRHVHIYIYIYMHPYTISQRCGAPSLRNHFHMNMPGKFLLSLVSACHTIYGRCSAANQSIEHLYAQRGRRSLTSSTSRRGAVVEIESSLNTSENVFRVCVCAF